MRTLAVISLAVLAACLTACEASPTSPPAEEGPPRAQLGEPQALTPPATGQRFTFSQAGSAISFVGAKVTGKHDGGFQRFAGEVLLGPAPSSSSVTVTIEMDSVTSDDAKLTEHLKNGDFFDSATHKTATFTSTSVTPAGAGGAHTVSGVLALRGVKKQITFPATIVATADAVTVDAHFAFDRKAFGILYKGKADNLIKDDVELKLKVVATKAPEAAAPASPAPADGAPADGAPVGTP